MGYVAKHRQAPVSPRKARRMVDLVRGKGVDEALSILAFQPQRSAAMLIRVIRSAQANAQVAGDVDIESLHVAKAWVDEGMVLKRWRARARGSADTILKRRSHICVELEPRFT